MKEFLLSWLNNMWEKIKQQNKNKNEKIFIKLIKVLIHM